jgi:hypothetical protein
MSIPSFLADILCFFKKAINIGPIKASQKTVTPA